MAILKVSNNQDDGFCRVMYELTNSKGQTLLYCLQDEGPRCGGVTFYRCTDDWGEPSHEVKPDPLKVTFERPTWDNETTRAVNKWIDAFIKRGNAKKAEVAALIEKHGDAYFDEEKENAN